MRSAAGLVLLFAATALAEDRPPVSPAKGFLSIQDACRKGDPKAMAKVIPDHLTESYPEEPTPKELDALRTARAAEVAWARPVEVREAVWDAIVRCELSSNGETASGEEAEFHICWGSTAWVLSRTYAFIVKGAALRAANGSAPASLRLAARRSEGPYGPSAFSFAHVTKDPTECLNRMDLWYCHLGDLHAVADGYLCRVAAKNLASVGRIPSARAGWTQYIATQAGGVYVMRCRRRQSHHFYVKFAIKSAGAKEVVMEWSLLATGFGTPASIHSPQPIASNASMGDEDRVHPLCNMQRSKPTPEPDPEPPPVPFPRQELPVPPTEPKK